MSISGDRAKYDRAPWKKSPQTLHSAEQDSIVTFAGAPFLHSGSFVAQ